MGTVASGTSARADRLALMARHLAEQGTITTAAIGAELGVSTMTARRDVDELVRQGLAYRTHGGAVAAGSTLPPTPDIAADAPSEAEERVAAAALATIAPGETIFLDAGRMSHLVARGIVAQGLAVTIVTNSLPTMLLTAGGGGQPAAKLFGLGGHFLRATRSYAGPVALRGVNAHYADRMLMCGGVTSDEIVCRSDESDVAVRRAMAAHADQVILLVEAGTGPGRSLLPAAGLAGAVVPRERVVAIAMLHGHGVPLQPA